MKPNDKTGNRWEFWAYAVFSVFAAGLVLYVFHFLPVAYTTLITEDRWAEYGAFFCFAISGALLLVFSLKKAQMSRRILWALMGFAALGIAGEEISWGQRLIDIPAPSALIDMNLQSELNIHNIEALKGVMAVLYDTISVAILLWIVASAYLSLRRAELYQKLVGAGIPLIPVRLAPVFLLTPFFFLLHPTAKPDEIGEMFLGLAVLIWAVDLILTRGISRRLGRQVVLASVMAAVSSVVVASAAFSSYHDSSGFKWRLNVMAARSYPGHGMIAQAETLFAYMRAHPEYRSPQTIFNHAIVLHEAGQAERAKQILSDAVDGLESEVPPESKRSQWLKMLGISYRLLGQTEKSDAAFAASIDLEQELFRSATSADQKARHLWESAKSMEAWGDKSSAAATIDEAVKIAEAPALRKMLQDWLVEIESGGISRVEY